MKNSDGGYGPSYNVQTTTEAKNKILVGIELSQARAIHTSWCRRWIDSSGSSSEGRVKCWWMARTRPKRSSTRTLPITAKPHSKTTRVTAGSLALRNG